MYIENVVEKENSDNEDEILDDFIPTEEDFAQADKEVALVQFATGKFKDDSDYWAYVSIPPSKYVAFKEAEESGKPICFEDFGEIIAEGSGTAPPDDVREEIETKYGLDSELESKIEQASIDAQPIIEEIEKRLMVEKYSGKSSSEDVPETEE